MMELADVPDSKSGGSDTVWVQVPLPAPHHLKNRSRFYRERFFKLVSITQRQVAALNPNEILIGNF